MPPKHSIDIRFDLEEIGSAIPEPRPGRRKFAYSQEQVQYWDDPLALPPAPADGGVYVIFMDHDEDDDELKGIVDALYVGEGSDIDKRLRAHSKVMIQNWDKYDQGQYLFPSIVPWGSSPGTSEVVADSMLRHVKQIGGKYGPAVPVGISVSRVVNAESFGQPLDLEREQHRVFCEAAVLAYFMNPRFAAADVGHRMVNRFDRKFGRGDV